MLRRTLSLMALFLLATGLAFAGPSDGDGRYADAFERLKTLAGTWQDLDEASEEVTYTLTASGSAVVERFDGMSSVYHMDGNDLRVTHYCGAKNQPRMKAVEYDAAKGFLRFDFVDVTNESAPDAYYTREVKIHFVDDENVEVRFNGLDKGVERPGTVRLRRK